MSSESQHPVIAADGKVLPQKNVHPLYAQYGFVIKDGKRSKGTYVICANGVPISETDEEGVVCMHHAMRAVYQYNVDCIADTVSGNYSQCILGPRGMWSDSNNDHAFGIIHVASTFGPYGCKFTPKTDLRDIVKPICTQGFHVSAFSSIKVHLLNTEPGQHPLGECIEDAEVQWIPLPLPIVGK